MTSRRLFYGVIYDLCNKLPVHGLKIKAHVSTRVSFLLNADEPISRDVSDATGN